MATDDQHNPTTRPVLTTARRVPMRRISMGPPGLGELCPVQHPRPTLIAGRSSSAGALVGGMPRRTATWLSCCKTVLMGDWRGPRYVLSKRSVVPGGNDPFGTGPSAAETGVFPPARPCLPPSLGTRTAAAATIRAPNPFPRQLNIGP